ncbi:recombinase family protein [Streptomyces sp. NPDC097981]|uniref:recombinase family protein n=1 Tax=Streptomyces sp. NPDC097981 TaxID=3155428 RepID=UPI0033301E63
MSAPGAVTGMRIHAAGYTRQSSTRDNRSEASPEDQREANHAKHLTYPDAVWCGHYEDLGISAFSGAERPDFERLLTDCRAGRINMVIVYYVSRFSRMDPLDAIPIVTELLNLGVTIVSVTEGEFRKGNVMDLIHLIMRLDAAHQESKNKSVAVRGAKEKAKALGGYIGGNTPYGFKLRSEMRITPTGRPIAVQLLAVHDDEAEVIRRAWGYIKAHLRETSGERAALNVGSPGSINGVCQTFNDDGTPTRGAAKGAGRAKALWEAATLKRILRDPRIAGYDAVARYYTDGDGNPTRQMRDYVIKRDPETMQPLYLEIEPIIPRDEWHELQTWLSARTRGSSGKPVPVTLLGGMSILECECEYNAGVLNDHATPSRSSYRCNRPTGGRPDGVHTGTNRILQKYADDYVAQRILAVITTAEDDPETAGILIEAQKRFGIATADPETARERTELVRERADAIQALEELYDALENGETYSGPIGQRRFNERKRKLEGRMSAAEHAIAEIEESCTAKLPITQWTDGSVNGDPIGEGSWWHGASMENRRMLVRLFVDKVIIHKTTRKGGTVPTPDEVAARLTVRFATGEADESAQELTA